MGSDVARALITATGIYKLNMEYGILSSFGPGNGLYCALTREHSPEPGCGGGEAFMPSEHPKYRRHRFRPQPHV